MDNCRLTQTMNSRRQCQILIWECVWWIAYDKSLLFPVTTHTDFTVLQCWLKNIIIIMQNQTSTDGSWKVKPSALYTCME